MAKEEKVIMQLSIPLSLLGVWKYYHPHEDFRDWIVGKVRDDIRILRSLSQKIEDGNIKEEDENEEEEEGDDEDDDN